jgi:hypothetical protein
MKTLPPTIGTVASDRLCSVGLIGIVRTWLNFNTECGASKKNGEHPEMTKKKQPTTEEQNKLPRRPLSAKEALERLRPLMGRTKFYALIKSGELRSYKNGGNISVDERHIDEFLSKCEA